MLSLCRQTDGQTDNRKTYAPDISIRGHEKYFGKWRKCWLQAFSPFPTIFSIDFFSQGC